jgi:hypothetical protein
MESTFGSLWAISLLPALGGLGFLLSILARRPSRAVGIGESVFLGICLLATAGLLAQDYERTRKRREFDTCLKKQSYEQCYEAIGPAGVIGNESYEN